MVSLTNTKVAGKIIGMLLELDKVALENLLNSEELTRKRVLLAVEELRRAWADNPQKLSELPQN